jgi:hypothetical protein
MIPHKYVWVQFADYSIAPGDPCPCGSQRLHRVHPNFLQCPECRAQLIVSEEDEEEGPGETRAQRRFRELSDIHLERRGQEGNLELYRGYGREAGTTVLLWIDFRLKPREEHVREEDVFDRVANVKAVPFPELSELFDAGTTDVSSLWNGNEPSWDFVWPQAPEPESEREAEEPID